MSSGDYPSHPGQSSGAPRREFVEIPLEQYERMMQVVKMARDLAGDSIDEVSRLREENRTLKEINASLQGIKAELHHWRGGEGQDREQQVEVVIK